MPAPDLCTVAAVKAANDITGTAADGVIADAIRDFSAWVRTFTNRDFQALSYTEIRDGSGGTELMLANGPATLVSSLTVCGVPIPLQPADGQAGYFLVEGGDVIALFGYCFTKSKRGIRVTYTSDGTIPADLARACADIVAMQFKRAKRGDPDQVSMTTGPQQGAQTFTWKLSDMPALSKSVLQRYSRVVPL